MGMKLSVFFFSVFAGLGSYATSCNDSHLLSYLRTHYDCPAPQNYHSIAINFKTYYFSHYSRFINACTSEGCYNGKEGIHGPILVSYCTHTLTRHTRVPASSNLVVPKVCKNRNLKVPQDYTDDTPARTAPQLYRHQNDSTNGRSVR